MSQKFLTSIDELDNRFGLVRGERGDVQDWVNLRIDERFREEGIEIPFKQLDVRMRS